MSKYEKLTDQPLVIALAEFRFSTILTMEKHVSAFQEHLRQDFPHFSKTQNQEMVIEGNSVKVTNSDGWLFLSSNKKRAFRLDKDRIIFMTSEYDRFPNFWKDCETALSFVSEKIKPSLLLRIGLRYSDLIIGKNEEDPIESYVEPIICNAGQLNNIGKQIHRTKETVLKTNDGFMVVRSLCGTLNLSAWPDLNEPPILIKKHSNPTKRILLDFDHFWQPEDETVDFTVDFINKKIHALHEKSREAFWEITTLKGRRVWK